MKSASHCSRVAAILLVGLLPGLAEAARLTQVRVGQHKEYTRVVLELDGPTSFRWEETQTAHGPELVVKLDASSATRVIASRSDLVESVVLRPDEAGAVARIRLRQSGVEVKELVLRKPSRIVLDLSPAPEPAAPLQTAVAKAAPEPEPTPEEPVAAPEISPVSMPSAAASEEPSAPLERIELERRAVPPPVAAAPPAPAPIQETEESGGVDRRVVSLVLIAAAIAVLLGVWMSLRNRSEQLRRAAARASWPPPPEERQSAERVVAERTADEPTQQASASETPLVSEDVWPKTRASDDEPQEDGRGAPVVEASLATTAIDTTPDAGEPEVVAEAEPASEREGELERRIARLETQLQEALDSRERLERQLTGHTEELRVQRAAIARTQRAVRAAVRPQAEPARPAQPPPPGPPGGGSL